MRSNAARRVACRAASTACWPHCRNTSPTLRPARSSPAAARTSATPIDRHADVSASAPRILPYRKPTEGRDYWLLDDALPDPMAVRERSLARTDWTEGYPYKPE